MLARKSMVLFHGEDSLNGIINTSSPIRRKSIVSQKSNSVTLSENDDEAERLARRRELQQLDRNSSSMTPLTSNNKRRSLGLGLVAQMSAPQMAERVTQCIKLSAENKINIKNAFSLEMIDFMTYMIKKKDTNMTNLQVASTSLDVSTKIYGYRVDGMHTDILRMMGGLDKQDDQAREVLSQTDGDQNDNNAEQAQLQEKVKKKKKSHQKILTSIESLKGTIETVNLTLAMHREGDSQTTDMLHQAMLPHHAYSGFYLHPYNDVIADTNKNNESEQQKDPIEVSYLQIDNILNSEICAPFTNFQFNGWSAEDEPEEEKEDDNTTKNNETNYQFDLDASLPDNDEPLGNDMNFFESEEDMENVNRCAIQRNDAVENIVDFRDAVTSASHNQPFEYSYVKRSVAIHWAGPMHWKIKSIPKSLTGSKVMEACRQEAVRKRKEIELQYDEEIKAACKERFVPGQAIKLLIKTAKTNWQEEKVTLPRDIHYDIIKATSFYCRPDVVLNFQKKNQVNTTQLEDDSVGYNYDNENDRTNYCPNVNTEDYHAGDDNDCDVGGAFELDDDGGLCTQPFTGDNLVTAPKLANKIFIPFSQRAKKIDMRQLKKCIWKCLLKTSSDKENIDIREAVENETAVKITESKNFADIYKELPKTLSKNNAEALSFPIAFVSLLHLANEKSLSVGSSSDMSDLIVQQN
ncbi:condensin complex subunit 2 [Cephus cinctus]|uniref:Condensin complex subunit 2 n=1 Tax=Cephus cinctus TaxID=211228 RepID=A0AAJ7CI06_CEPCN|nr:condensin complex subunit 2 [Cephus cinctus]XP_024935742.1 condensin complex subunit 2 [Cephus cinctus]